MSPLSVCGPQPVHLSSWYQNIWNCLCLWLNIFWGNSCLLVSLRFSLRPGLLTSPPGSFSNPHCRDGCFLPRACGFLSRFELKVEVFLGSHTIHAPPTLVSLQPSPLLSFPVTLYQTLTILGFVYSAFEIQLKKRLCYCSICFSQGLILFSCYSFANLSKNIMYGTVIIIVYWSGEWKTGWLDREMIDKNMGGLDRSVVVWRDRLSR